MRLDRIKSIEELERIKKIIKRELVYRRYTIDAEKVFFYYIIDKAERELETIGAANMLQYIHYFTKNYFKYENTNYFNSDIVFDYLKAIGETDFKEFIRLGLIRAEDIAIYFLEEEVNDVLHGVDKKMNKKDNVGY